MNKIGKNLVCLEQNWQRLRQQFFIVLVHERDETRKTKQNSKTAIFDKLRDSIVSEEEDSMGVEDLSRNVDSPDDAAELIKRMERIMKSKKNSILVLTYHQGIIFKSSRLQFPILK